MKKFIFIKKPSWIRCLIYELRNILKGNTILTVFNKASTVNNYIFEIVF